MKNLKKVLALVLALATVMGLGITASAKEYTDANSIEYTEAVEVMSMIGILDGNPDGSFNPQGNLTRAQAAKMVSYLLNSGKDVNDLYSGSNTFTDCYSSWAKGYIAYVNQMGIVTGVGNGKFNPNGTLTGVQLAKMMLTSLGYDAKIEGYQNNDNWQVNIINDAKNAGLLDDMDDVNLYNAITREQASQMMFNALKADMVGYENRGSEITLPGIGTIVQGASTPKAEENTKTSYVADGGEQPDGFDAGKAGDLQLVEKYFEGLTLTNDGSAKTGIGVPGYQWTYTKDKETTESAVYAAAPDQSIVVSKAGKDADYWAGEAKKDMTVTTSGTPVVINDGGETAQAHNGTLNVGDIVAFYNVGDTTANVADKVYVTRYTADVITEVDTDVSDDDAEDGVTAYITFENAGQFDNTEIAGYDAKTYVEDAVVALVVGNNDYAGTIVASYIPETVEGAITAYSSTNRTYTIGGTKYTLTGTADDEVNFTASKVDFDEGNYRLYLDQNGYVLKTEIVKGTTTIGDVFYLNDINGTNLFWTEKTSVKGVETYTYYVQAVYLDGTVKDLKIAELSLKDGVDAGNKTAFEATLNAMNTSNVLFTDTKQDLDAKDSDDVTVETALSKWTDSEYSAADVTANIAGVGNAIEIKTSDKTLDGKYLTSKTNYVVIESYNDEPVATVKTGGISFAGDSDDGDKVYMVADADTKEALYVIIVTDSFSTAATGDFFYVADDTKTTVSGGTQYTVIGMDGKEMDIVVDKDNSDVSTLSAGNVYKFAVLTNGNYNVTGTADNVDATYYMSHFGTLLTVNGNSEVVETANAVIYDDHDTDVYNKSINSLAAMKTAAENWTVNVKVVYTDSDKDEVKMIIVTSVDKSQQNQAAADKAAADLVTALKSSTSDNSAGTAADPIEVASDEFSGSVAGTTADKVTVSKVVIADTDSVKYSFAQVDSSVISTATVAANAVTISRSGSNQLELTDYKDSTGADFNNGDKVGVEVTATVGGKTAKVYLLVTVTDAE